MNNGWSWASNERLYETKSWKDLRLVVLEKEPLCRICKTMNIYTPAYMVDHIISITQANWKELFLDINNLQPLCDPCHKFKTNRDKISKKNIDMNEILGY